MRSLRIAATLLLISAAGYAQQNTAVAPVAPPVPTAGPVLHIDNSNADSRLDVEIGAIRLTTHSGRYTFAYLPLLAPLPGTAFRPSQEMPNALALTGATIPQRPHTRQLHDVRVQ